MILYELLVMCLLQLIGGKLFIVIRGYTAVSADPEKTISFIRVDFWLCWYECFFSGILTAIYLPKFLFISLRNNAPPSHCLPVAS